MIYDEFHHTDKTKFLHGMHAHDVSFCYRIAFFYSSEYGAPQGTTFSPFSCQVMMLTVPSMTIAHMFSVYSCRGHSSGIFKLIRSTFPTRNNSVYHEKHEATRS